MSKEIGDVKLRVIRTNRPKTRSQSAAPGLYWFEPIPPDPNRRYVGAYTIKANGKSVGGGSHILAKCPKSHRGERVAIINNLAEVNGKLIFEVYWYSWPDETAGGNQPFYAQKEIFATDDGDYLSSEDDVLDRCSVLNFKQYANYANTAPITQEDYLCRFTYDLSDGYIKPSTVPVFCICEMPLNPDQFMLKCVACPNRYHPSCLGMTIDEAKQLDKYVCCDKVELAADKTRPLVVKKPGGKLETLEQEKMEKMSKEEITKKLYADADFFVAYYEKLDKENPFNPSSSSSSVNSNPYPSGPGFYSPSYEYKPWDDYPCDKFKNINEIIYSGNPEAEAKRLKVVEIYKQKKIEACKAISEGY